MDPCETASVKRDSQRLEERIKAVRVQNEDVSSWQPSIRQDGVKSSSLEAAQHLRWLRQQPGALMEVRWKQVLNPLLKVFDKQRREVQKRIVVLQDAYVPAEIERWLRKGPKFAVPPHISAHELVGLNRDLSVKANQDRDRCLQDAQPATPDTTTKLSPRDVPTLNNHTPPEAAVSFR
ncbi:hypothetical protein HPB51_016478 [Rhipicephalus microplus]|uniref:Uncharacterized protein n=1 Tax=Rhipicephalus microplus TaxID=6941 RepID=A0A9J6DNZ7_RHIMP|nr:hypothetical protein HPB51_016478 [Rhipicephalus microplus]